MPHFFVSKQFVFVALGAGLLLGPAASTVSAQEAELVNIKSVDRTIKVDLRYAGTRNIAGRPLYPKNMPALVRPQVAAQLAAAQAILRERGYGLKIWDAYRPKSAHEQLWQYSRNGDYVADPAAGGSIHTCGAAVDATLVDNRGHDVPMPTDFDDFTMAAMLNYTGNNAEVRQNLYFLQNAMARAGFYGLRTEWWHFVTKDWQGYQPIPEIMIVRQGLLPTQPARALPVRPAEPLTRSSPPPSGGIPASPPLQRSR